MGGRGGSSGITAGGNGRKGNISELVSDIRSGNREKVLDELSDFSPVPQAAQFTSNYNALKSQTAEIEIGDTRVSLRYSNTYNPMQVSKPTSAITTEIHAVTFKNGNIMKSVTLVRKDSKSLGNAKKNYEEVTQIWKKITKQKSIGW